MTFTADEKKQIAAMLKLGMSQEEAEQTILDDRDDFMTDEMREMEQNAKKNGLLKVNARQVTDPSGKKKTRERKPNEDKRYIIQWLEEAVETNCGACEVVNVERQIDFQMNGVCYSITLTAHRPPKKGK